MALVLSQYALGESILKLFFNDDATGEVVCKELDRSTSWNTMRTWGPSWNPSRSSGGKGYAISNMIGKSVSKSVVFPEETEPENKACANQVEVQYTPVSVDMVDKVASWMTDDDRAAKDYTYEAFYPVGSKASAAWYGPELVNRDSKGKIITQDDAGNPIPMQHGRGLLTDIQARHPEYTCYVLKDKHEALMHILLGR